MKRKVFIESQDGGIRTLTKIALMAAVICILGPFSVPIGPVPISLTILGILLAVYLLGMRKGTASCVIYILLGLVGLPVFSGFRGGPGTLFGPTGGYIIGYVFLAVIAGFFVEFWPEKLYMHFIGMVLGVAVCYAFGTVWFSILMECTIAYALKVCVVPFIAWDLVKIAITLIVGPLVRKRMLQAGLY